MPSEVINGNFRLDRLPHIWCKGCGHGILMHAVARAIDELEIDTNFVFVKLSLFKKNFTLSTILLNIDFALSIIIFILIFIFTI